jgi:hypothetical protein
MPKVSAIGWKNQIYDVHKLRTIIRQERVGFTPGSSIKKCDNKTYLVQCHCSAAVGTFVGWSFHFLKYGIASMMIHGIQRPK